MRLAHPSVPHFHIKSVAQLCSLYFRHMFFTQTQMPIPQSKSVASLTWISQQWRFILSYQPTFILHKTPRDFILNHKIYHVAFFLQIPLILPLPLRQNLLHNQYASLLPLQLISCWSIIHALTMLDHLCLLKHALLFSTTGPFHGLYSLFRNLFFPSFPHSLPANFQFSFQIFLHQQGLTDIACSCILALEQVVCPSIPQHSVFLSNTTHTRDDLASSPTRLQI